MKADIMLMILMILFLGLIVRVTIKMLRTLKHRIPKENNQVIKDTKEYKQFKIFTWIAYGYSFVFIIMALGHLNSFMK